MITADLWSKRSVCRRYSVGAVIASPDLKKIISFGYNGPLRGFPHDSCTNEIGRCGCVHAEANAIYNASDSLVGAVMFSTVYPCARCAEAIIQVRISKVFYGREYRETLYETHLEKAGVITQQLPYQIPDDFAGRRDDRP